MTQKQTAVQLLNRNGMMRLAELRQAGIAGTTLSRMERDGEIRRVNRGLYQLADASISENYELAEAAKLVPAGVICLTSALAFHELTDTIPNQIWMAIPAGLRTPRILKPGIHFVRFTQQWLTREIEEHSVDQVMVRITSPARSVVDAFRYRNTVGLGIAIQGLQELLKTRKATPSQVQRLAQLRMQWRVMRPYVEAIMHG